MLSQVSEDEKDAEDPSGGAAKSKKKRKKKKKAEEEAQVNLKLSGTVFVDILITYHKLDHMLFSDCRPRTQHPKSFLCRLPKSRIPAYHLLRVG